MRSAYRELERTLRAEAVRTAPSPHVDVYAWRSGRAARPSASPSSNSTNRLSFRAVGPSDATTAVSTSATAPRSHCRAITAWRPKLRTVASASARWLSSRGSCGGSRDPTSSPQMTAVAPSATSAGGTMLRASSTESIVAVPFGSRMRRASRSSTAPSPSVASNAAMISSASYSRTLSRLSERRADSFRASEASSASATSAGTRSSIGWRRKASIAGSSSIA